MCGRFTLILEPDLIQEELELGSMPPEMQARYNIAPSQPIAAVLDSESRNVELLRWGLVPGWAKDPSIGDRMINARSETLAEKPSFRNAYARRRCLILADGFYEWERVSGKRSTPNYFQLKDEKVFTFAGLWELWQPKEGDALRTCTIITCPANEMVSALHERMPVILDAERRWQWLTPGTPLQKLQAMLIPYPAEKMTRSPVSTLVNSPQNDSPEVLRPNPG